MDLEALLLETGLVPFLPTLQQAGLGSTAAIAAAPDEVFLSPAVGMKKMHVNKIRKCLAGSSQSPASPSPPDGSGSSGGTAGVDGKTSQLFEIGVEESQPSAQTAAETVAGATTHAVSSSVGAIGANGDDGWRDLLRTNGLAEFEVAVAGLGVLSISDLIKEVLLSYLASTTPATSVIVILMPCR